MSIEITRRIDELRAAANKELQVLEALLFCSFELTQRNFDAISKRRALISAAPKKNIKRILVSNKEMIREARSKYGAKLPNSEYVDRYQLIRSSGIALNTYLPKRWFEALFKHCDKIFPGFLDTPRHALYGLALPPQSDEIGLRGFVLPEVTLFEDMAVLFNEAFTLQRNNSDSLDRKATKRRRAINRSCVLSALGFVEAYLNGIAHDFLLQSDRQSITNKDLALLLERSEESIGKEKFISLRAKIFQYPRIVLGLRHPPLTESDCPGIDVLLTVGKSIRDAITHPTFRPTVKKNQDGTLIVQSEKAAPLVWLRFEDLERIVDSAVTVVLTLDKKLGGKLEHVIKPRSQDGTFPDEVFS